MPQKDPPPSWAVLGKFGFLSFSKIIPPLGGGSTQKSISRLLSRTRGYLMPNLVEIPPVVWAPNSNKQTNKQTNRQTGLFYIYRFLNASCLCLFVFFSDCYCGIIVFSDHNFLTIFLEHLPLCTSIYFCSPSTPFVAPAIGRTRRFSASIYFPLVWFKSSSI